MLSPNWSSLWPIVEPSLAGYDTDDVKKIAVLMTDGEYNTVYDSTASKRCATTKSICGTRPLDLFGSSAVNGCSSARPFPSARQ